MPNPSTSKIALAADAWRSVFDFIVATSDQRVEVLSRLGLTPNDSRALGSLERQSGRTMRTLAKAWRCDASTATWIVDRLEAKGLAERLPHPADRRVRLVVLTARGVDAKAEIIAAVYTPPPALLELDRAALVALRDAAAPLRGLAELRWNGAEPRPKLWTHERSSRGARRGSPGSASGTRDERGAQVRS